MENPNIRQLPKNKPKSGFTIIELLTAVAIIGILSSLAIPSYIEYSVRANVTEGVLLLAELRTRIEVEFNRNQEFPDEIPGAPRNDGRRYGGPVYKYATLFSQPSDMWDQIEYQAKGPHRVLALRAKRLPEWERSDIGLHLQLRANSDGTLSSRCTVNNSALRAKYVPGSCATGRVNDWRSWN